ncbi:MAG: FIMAH domain-containing protein, partial [Acidimicrobiia bacterium]
PEAATTPMTLAPQPSPAPYRLLAVAGGLLALLGALALWSAGSDDPAPAPSPVTGAAAPTTSTTTAPTSTTPAAATSTVPATIPGPSSFEEALAALASTLDEAKRDREIAPHRARDLEKLIEDAEKEWEEQDEDDHAEKAAEKLEEFLEKLEEAEDKEEVTDRAADELRELAERAIQFLDVEDDHDGDD